TTLFRSASEAPACHTAKRSISDRYAEPEPRRASRESCREDNSPPKAVAAAVASAAKPEADEAIPAAVGPSLLDTTCAAACAVSSPACAAMSRTKSKNAVVRAVALVSAVVPLSSKVSEPLVRATLVVVANLFRVIDMDPAAGMISLSSAFPQYFTSAILGWARATAATSGPPCEPVRSVRSSIRSYSASTRWSRSELRPPPSWLRLHRRPVPGPEPRLKRNHPILNRSALPHKRQPLKLRQPPRPVPARKHPNRPTTNAPRASIGLRESGPQCPASRPRHPSDWQGLLQLDPPREPECLAAYLRHQRQLRLNLKYRYRQ